MLFSLPITGAFQRSLTVLCAIGHIEYLSLENGLSLFKQNHTCSVLLNEYIYIGNLLDYLKIGFYPFYIIFLAFFNFAHHYSQNQFSFLFLLLLRCFTSQSYFFSFLFRVLYLYFAIVSMHSK